MEIAEYSAVATTSKSTDKIRFLNPAAVRQLARKGSRTKKALAQKWQNYVNPNVSVTFIVPSQLINSDEVSISQPPTPAFTEPARKLLNTLFNEKKLSVSELRMTWSGSTGDIEPGALLMVATFHVM